MRHAVVGAEKLPIPDESKGERLVAFYASKDVSPETLWSRLCESNLPKLWIPKRDNLYCIDSIPLLGTGKVDLKKVRALALELAHADAAGHWGVTGASTSMLCD